MKAGTRTDANSSFSNFFSAFNGLTNNNCRGGRCGRKADKTDWLRTCNELRKLFQRIETELVANGGGAESGDIEACVQRGDQTQYSAIDQVRQVFQSRLQREIINALGEARTSY